MNAMSNIYDTNEELFVKICGITSEADALLCISLGADAVGFIFAPSPRQVSVQTAGDIAKRLPPEIITVGVFRDEAPQRVVDMVHQASLGAAQLHGHESSPETKWIRSQLPMVIKAFPAGDRTISRFEDFGADYLLVDGTTPRPGSRCRPAARTPSWCASSSSTLAPPRPKRTPVTRSMRIRDPKSRTTGAMADG